MTKRSINTSIEELLVSNEPFEYAHLIKFERPFPLEKDTNGNYASSEFRTNANRYAYFTDASRDISFNDSSTDHDGNGNGSQIYRANRLNSIGSYSETTAPRATNMKLSLSGNHLGTSSSFTGDFSSAAFTVDAQVHDDRDTTDLLDFGFREGDKVKITKNSGNFSTGVNSVTYIITGFTTSNRQMTFTTTGNDVDDTTTYPSDTSVGVTISIESDELVGGTTSIPNIELSSPSFLNREVFVHKIFINPETGDIVGNSSILVFKGMISSCSTTDDSANSVVEWGLTSHWGDFKLINGRLTTDEIHRALDAKGQPQPKLAIKPEYSTDLGFLHSEVALNQIANYKTYETRTVTKTKKRGGGYRLVGATKNYDVQVTDEINHTVDLNIGLTGKYLPVVYGVQKLAGIPVFADTLKTSSKEVYLADAICEGEIHGIYNMTIDGIPLICIDEADYYTRAEATTQGTTVNGYTSDKEGAQMQCYGRADRGDTLGTPTAASQVNAAYATAIDLTSTFDPTAAVDHEAIPGETNSSQIEASFRQTMYDKTVLSVAQAALQNITDTNQFGIQHEKFGSIQSPYNMQFHFFKGSTTQRAASIFTTVAGNNDFKRQADYYTGAAPYWNSGHRLLDTAYTANVFTLGPDNDSVPDVEYTVKGKVFECFNYDNSYRPDLPLGGSDAHTNFLEGDTVTVERSTNGSSWSTTNVEGTASDTSFRILDKYTLTNNDETLDQRFRLDQTPDLDAVNGVPTYTFLRMKKTGSNNYWHMRTWNHARISNGQFDIIYYTPSAVGKNSENEIQLTFANTTAGNDANDAALLNGGYEESNAGKLIYTFRIAENKQDTDYGHLHNTLQRGVWDGNVVTFPGTNYPGIANATGITIYKSRSFYLPNSSHGVGGVTANTELEGCTITLDRTGEKRIVESFNHSTNRIKIDYPFQALDGDYAEVGTTFSITGLTSDKRASSNPALQLTDYLTAKRYGKGLNLHNDLNLASFQSAAKLCDVRSDVGVVLNADSSVAVGDIYKLVNASGGHVASGTVIKVESKTKTIDESTSTVKKVTFGLVSGKFIRAHQNYIYYYTGDIIIGDDGALFRANSNGYIQTKPKVGALQGTTSVGGTLALTKESGSGASTITIDAAFGLTYSLYDADFVKYWRYLGWEHHRQCFVTRHQTNITLDTAQSVFANVNTLLAHFNGMLAYENGKYVLDVETQASTPTAATSFNSVTYNWNINPEYIDNSDIIGAIKLEDNSQRTAKNSIKASISDPQNNFASRSVSFFNSEFLESDRNVVKTATIALSGITSYFNARMGVERELTATRFSKNISFKVGTKGLLLRTGQVIAVSYEPFSFTSKLFRIENLNFNPDCTVSIKATEYDDSMYAITAARANTLRLEGSTQQQAGAAPGAPTSLAATTTKPGTILLSWNNPTDFTDSIDDIEVFTATTNNRGHSSYRLLTVLDNETTFSDNSAGAATNFYWVRTRRVITQGKNRTILTSAYHPTSATGGVTGTAKLLAPALTFDRSSVIFNFSSSGDLDPSGTGQDTTITVNKQNLTGTPTITLLDADGSSQSDIQFTTGNTSITANSATIDASTSTSTSTPKIVRATLTESGETFTVSSSIAFVKQGSTAGATKLLTHFVYHQASASSQPNTPSATSYNFANNTFNGLTGGWATTPPVFVAGNTNKYWYSYFTAEENTAGGNISSGSNLVFQASLQGIGFTGLVTFTSGSSGAITGYNPATIINANTTTIDGGKLTTGTITADRLKLANTGAITIGSLTNDSGFTNDDVANSKTTASAAASAANSAAKTAGSVGGLTLTSSKMHIGTGTHNNANTAFYVDSSGKMSLKDKLVWDGTTLSISGNITIGNASDVRSAINVADGATTDAAANNAQSTADGKTTASAAASAANSAGKTGGSIGGWAISSTTITSGNITLNNSTNQILISD